MRFEWHCAYINSDPQLSYASVSMTFHSWGSHSYSCLTRVYEGNPPEWNANRQQSSSCKQNTLIYAIVVFMSRIRVITIKFLFQEDLEMTGVTQVDEGFEWSNEALLPVVSLDGAATFEHARSVAPLQVLAAQAAAKAGPFVNSENRRLVFGVCPV